LKLEDLTKIKEKRNKEKKTKAGKSTKFEENILKAIEKSKANSLNRVLVSLGIQGVGVNQSKEIVKNENFNSIEKIMESDEEALKQIDGIGDVVASNIYNFFRKEKNRDIILKLKEHGIRMEVQEEKENSEDIEIVSEIFKDKIFVLTGNFSKPKKEIEKEIIANGGIVKSSITKDTNIVIYEKETSSKYKKAEKLGIERITEEEYNNMLGK